MSHGTNLSNFNVLKRTIKKKRNPPHPVPLVPPARCMVVSQAPLLRVVFPSLISALRCLCSECSLLPMLVPPSGPAAAPQRGEAGGGLGVWPCWALPGAAIARHKPCLSQRCLPAI